jgi:hypothetical protein
MTTPRRASRLVEYAIEVAGVIDPRWSEWFDDLEVSILPPGSDVQRTILIARVPDQSALPALLSRVTGLNLTVLSVTPRSTSG